MRRAEEKKLSTSRHCLGKVIVRYLKVGKVA